LERYVAISFGSKFSLMKAGGLTTALADLALNLCTKNRKNMKCVCIRTRRDGGCLLYCL